MRAHALDVALRGAASSGRRRRATRRGPRWRAPVVACTTGMKTPSTSTVTSTVAIAAKRRHGVAAQRAQRLAQEEAEPHRTSLRRGRRRGASARRAGARLGSSRISAANSRVDSVPRTAGRLVAHDAAVRQLDHAAAHPVDHRVVVRGDDHRRAGAVDPVEQLHDPDRRLGVEVAGRLVGQQQRRVVDERARDARRAAARRPRAGRGRCAASSRGRSGAGCPGTFSRISRRVPPVTCSA